jgi:hypothetical protein
MKSYTLFLTLGLAAGNLSGCSYDSSKSNARSNIEQDPANSSAEITDQSTASTSSPSQCNEAEGTYSIFQLDGQGSDSDDGIDISKQDVGCAITLLTSDPAEQERIAKILIRLNCIKEGKCDKKSILKHSEKVPLIVRNWIKDSKECQKCNAQAWPVLKAKLKAANEDPGMCVSAAVDKTVQIIKVLLKMAEEQSSKQK